MPKNTTHWPRPGLKPGPLDLESSALTMRPLCLYSVICCSIAILSNYILLYIAKQLHKVYTITSCIETATFYPKYYSSGHRMHASNVGFFCLLFVIFFFALLEFYIPWRIFEMELQMSMLPIVLWAFIGPSYEIEHAHWLWSNFILGRLSQKP